MSDKNTKRIKKDDSDKNSDKNSDILDTPDINKLIINDTTVKKSQKTKKNSTKELTLSTKLDDNEIIIMKSFNMILSSIITKLSSKFPKDPMILSISSKFQIARREVPELIFIHGGRVIWTYREYIKNRDVNKILNLDASQEINNLIPENELLDSSKADQLYKVITQLKLKWQYFNQTEQNCIIDEISKLLFKYAEYLQYVKQKD